MKKKSGRQPMEAQVKLLTTSWWKVTLLLQQSGKLARAIQRSIFDPHSAREWHCVIYERQEQCWQHYWSMQSSAPPARHIITNLNLISSMSSVKYESRYLNILYVVIIIQTLFFLKWFINGKYNNLVFPWYTFSKRMESSNIDPRKRKKNRHHYNSLTVTKTSECVI